MRLSALCGLLLLAGCEPNLALPVKVMAIVPSRSNNYETRQVELTTPTSAVHLTGPVISFVGGTQIELNPRDPQLRTYTSEEQLRDLLVKNKGGPVRANFVDKSGVQWPADFHTWQMVTTFYNFEQAFLYFQKIYDGKLTAEIKDVQVLYWGSFVHLGVSDKELRDNAIFYPPVKAFMVVPFEELQKIPFSMNLGVIGHEFSHLVFNKKVYGGASIPAALDSWTLAPFNLLKGMDEGLADFHGYGVTCGTVANGPGCLPNFLSVSFDATRPNDQKLLAERDMTNIDVCMTTELRNAFNNFTTSEFLRAGLEYRIGTLIAASLYQASVPFGKEEQMQKALIEALDQSSASRPTGFRQLISLNLQTPQAFTPELMANTIAAHISDLPLRKEVCKQLSDRLQLACSSFPCAAMPACDTATRGTRCPIIPQ